MSGNASEQFNVPVVLFLFKRANTVMRILDVLRVVQPSKLFLVGDGPRHDGELQTVLDARRKIEEGIDWPCNVVKNYAETNRGVFENIAGGAKWVFSKVDKAIFLEDDNLPQESFFPFCKEMLERYETEESVFWICGTNYLNNYASEDGASYVFSRHLLPCGWASWADKFERYYDSDFSLLECEDSLRKAEETYPFKALYRQQKRSARSEVYRKRTTGEYASWDFQLPLTLRANGLVGVVPHVNQIENIGVDEFSIHGGTSFSNEMTKRFCSITAAPLQFPLNHPSEIVVNDDFEKKIGRVLLTPLAFRIKEVCARFVKRLFGVNEFDKFQKKNMRWFR